MKAAALGKRGVEENDPDPRPKKYRRREGYQAEVNMRTVNYCAFTNRDSCWRFKFGAANVQAAVVDHSYTKIPFTEL